MACPTCSGTMHCFGSLGNFWCPRCGTIVRVGGTVAGVPKLVERCRDLVRMIANTAAGRWLKEQVEVSSVLESVHKPEDR